MKIKQRKPIKMFITFEGLDNSGKTTQAELIVDRLRKNGKHVIFLREPGGTVISEKIRDILLDKKHLELFDITELLLFSAARSQLISEVIQPALKSGKIVICDRFYDSTTAYQGYGRGINLDDIKAINRIATSGIAPNITFFVDIEVDEIFRRQAATGVLSDRMESSGKAFFTKVRNGFWSLAQTESNRFILINGKQPIEDIHNEIWNFIQNKII